MAKGETFGDIFPGGTCCLCGRKIEYKDVSPGQDQADCIMHYECAISYEDAKSRSLKD